MQVSNASKFNVKVRGGYKDEDGTFWCTREVVVTPRDVGTLFRRDDALRGMSVIMTSQTTEQPTVSY